VSSPCISVLILCQGPKTHRQRQPHRGQAVSTIVQVHLDNGDRRSLKHAPSSDRIAGLDVGSRATGPTGLDHVVHAEGPGAAVLLARRGQRHRAVASGVAVDAIGRSPGEGAVHRGGPYRRASGIDYGHRGPGLVIGAVVLVRHGDVVHVHRAAAAGGIRRFRRIGGQHRGIGRRWAVVPTSSSL